MTGPLLVVSAHAADFVWRCGGYIAQTTAAGGRAEVDDRDTLFLLTGVIRELAPSVILTHSRIDPFFRKFNDQDRIFRGKTNECDQPDLRVDIVCQRWQERKGKDRSKRTDRNSEED